jgi:hypothetical protein
LTTYPSSVSLIFPIFFATASTHVIVLKNIFLLKHYVHNIKIQYIIWTCSHTTSGERSIPKLKSVSISTGHHDQTIGQLIRSINKLSEIIPTVLVYHFFVEVYFLRHFGKYAVSGMRKIFLQIIFHFNCQPFFILWQ